MRLDTMICLDRSEMVKLCLVWLTQGGEILLCVSRLFDILAKPTSRAFFTSTQKKTAAAAACEAATIITATAARGGRGQRRALVVVVNDIIPQACCDQEERDLGFFVEFGLQIREWRWEIDEESKGNDMISN